jgi:hypothetical protein
MDCAGQGRTGYQSSGEMPQIVDAPGIGLPYTGLPVEAYEAYIEASFLRILLADDQKVRIALCVLLGRQLVNLGAIRRAGSGSHSRKIPL